MTIETEKALCTLLRPKRLRLPVLALETLYPHIDSAPILLSKLPQGAWRTPLDDVAILLKLLKAAQSRRILELGSYRGFTALALAENAEPQAQIVTLDSQHDHGEAYRGSPSAAKIERRVGAISEAAFGEEDRNSFDLIFLDGDHAYAPVKSDTSVALPLLAPTGYLVWHDYANWGYFSGFCRVPEFLHELAQELPIVHIARSNLALYSPAWRDQAAPALQHALQATRELSLRDHWKGL